MQGSSRKDIMFFSNYCEYCTDIINSLIRKNAKQDFMMVCVDNNKYNLPEFVDRVPIIYTKNDEIIYDEGITKYIELMYPSVSEEISPFSLQNTDIGNSFSFLNDELPDMHSKGYTMLGYDQRISSPPEPEDGSKKAKMDSSVFDRFVQERNADIEEIKKKMGNDNGLRI